MSNNNDTEFNDEHKERIKRALEKMKDKDTSKYWQFSDGVLYQMCAKKPGHDKRDIVAGKLMLIGRTYAAALERRKTADGLTTEEFYYDKAVPALLGIGEDIDSALAELNKYESIDENNMDKILSLHGKLVDIFEPVTGQRKRSFASKYLHFHCPEMFYIYDERARSSICKLVSLKSRRSYPGDGEYALFFRKAMALRDFLKREHGTDLSPREIDNLLLYSTDQE